MINYGNFPIFLRFLSLSKAGFSKKHVFKFNSGEKEIDFSRKFQKHLNMHMFYFEKSHNETKMKNIVSGAKKCTKPNVIYNFFMTFDEINHDASFEKGSF